jgi:hypothetical protein
MNLDQRASILERPDGGSEMLERNRLHPSGTQGIEKGAAATRQDNRLMAVLVQGGGKIAHMNLHSPDQVRSCHDVGDSQIGPLEMAA